jgi:hypothetical protein
MKPRKSWFRNGVRNHAETIRFAADRNHPKPSETFHPGFGLNTLRHNGVFGSGAADRNHPKPSTYPKTETSETVCIDTVRWFRPGSW